jgi:colicin import membrane protein
MMSNALPYTVPQEPGRWASIALAVLMHALLLAFLWIGINWVNNKPETVQAEVWSEKELLQAPPPVQAPEPEPVVKQAPREVKPAPVAVDPEIAIEQEKKKKRLEKEKKDHEQEIARQAENEKKKTVAKEKEKEKEKEKDDKKKLADDKRKQDDLDKKKMTQQREAEIKRITGETAKFDASGTAARSEGGRVDSSWAARVKAKIKSLTRIAVSSENNDPVEYDVRLLPSGEVAGMRKIRSSGIPEFDDAVRRAIELAAPYPPDSSGRVPPDMPIIYRPKDQ